MSLGDIISEIAPLATTLNFQPAGTIEVIVTSVGFDGRTGLGCYVRDAALIVTMASSSVPAAYSPEYCFNGGGKIGITNTHYYESDAAPAGFTTGFTAIQTRE